MFGKGKLKKEIDFLKSDLNRRDNTINSQKGLIKKLLILLEGCKKHPSYRAVRKPTATCSTCETLFDLRQCLNESRTARIMGYKIRTGKRS